LGKLFNPRYKGVLDGKKGSGKGQCFLDEGPALFDLSAVERGAGAICLELEIGKINHVQPDG
jgi:hypothetical protein